MASGTSARRGLYYSISRGDDGTLQFDPPVDSPELAIALSYHFPRPKTLEGKMQAAILQYLQEPSVPSKPQIQSSDAPVEANHSSSQASGLLDSISKQPQLPSHPTPPLDLQPYCLADEYSQRNPEYLNSASNLSYYHFQRHGDAAKQSLTDLITPPDPPLLHSKQNPDLSLSPSTPRDDSRAIPWISYLQQFPNSDPIPDVITASQTQLGWVWNSRTGRIKNKGRKRKYEPLEAEQVLKNRGNACEKHKRMKKKCDPKKCPVNKQFKPDPPPTTPSFPTSLAESSPSERGKPQSGGVAASPSSQSSNNSRLAHPEEASVTKNPILFADCEIDTDHSHIFRATDDPARYAAWKYASTDIEDLALGPEWLDYLDDDFYLMHSPSQDSLDVKTLCGMGYEVLVDDQLPTWIDPSTTDVLTKKKKQDEHCEISHDNSDKDDDDEGDSSGHEGGSDSWDFNGGYGGVARKDDDDGSGGAGACGSTGGSTNSANQRAVLWAWKMHLLAVYLRAFFLAACLEFARVGAFDKGHERQEPFLLSLQDRWRQVMAC